MAYYKPRYLEKIKMSRGPRRIGEIFTMKFRGIGYIFGRVIRDDCAPAPDIIHGGPWPRMKGLYLLYIYKDVSDTLETIPKLRPDRLLVPPLMSGNGGWTVGYFLQVRHEPLMKKDILKRRCFGLDAPEGQPQRYVDEYGRRLTRRHEPCFSQGIDSYGSIENAIAKELGLPHEAPDLDDE